MPVPTVAELWGLRNEVELIHLSKRADTPSWLRAWRQRERWDPRWTREWTRILEKQNSKVDIAPLVKEAQKAWGVGRLRKQRAEPPSAEEIAARIEMEIDEEQFSKGAVAAYIGLGLGESEDSGQFTLDALGLDKTFAWANPRDFAGNVLAVRGSKIIQGIYGNHRDRLAKMVIAKCDPRQPRTIGQLTKEIRQEWSALTKHEAARIARTESAFVWETTNWNAMALNGVLRVEWLVASGPAIGKSVGPVCETCLKAASLSPYVMDDMGEIPPLHPHCRCTLVPEWTPEWLPPAEPWVGAEKKLEVFV